MLIRPKLWLYKYNNHFKEWCLPISLSLITGIVVILKVFVIDGCYAFDANDDANHTFPNLYVALSMLSRGVVPQINYYNNFGSPLLGDALTYPFSIHSITYYFLPGYLAMTVNRFLLAVATILSGYVFFREYLSRNSSSICSLLTFYTAVSIWFFATYHMQTTLMFMFLGLAIINKIICKEKIFYYVMFYLVVSAMLLSLSLNLSVFIVGYLLLFFYISNNCSVGKKGIAILFVLIACLVIAYPQFVSFYEGMSGSVRGGSHYDQRATFTFVELLRHVISYYGFTQDFRMHTDTTVFLSAPFVIFCMVGVVIIRKYRDTKMLLLVLALGIIPSVISYCMMVFPSIWWSIPLLRSVDLTRIIWLSSPFIVLSIGFVLDKISCDGTIYRKLGIVTLLMIFIELALATNSKFDKYTWISTLLIMLVCVINLLCFYANNKIINNKLLNLASVFLFSIAFAIGLFTMVTGVFGIDNMKVCRNTHHYSMEKDAYFRPGELVGMVEPMSRLACYETTWQGNDFRGVYSNILGSNQRAITSQKSLLEYLKSLDVIEIEVEPNMPYHFKPPWDKEKLAKLGIRYIVQSNVNEKAEDDGWIKLGQSEGKYLYENPYKPSPIYISKPSGDVYINKYDIVNNSIIVTLPVITERVAFTAAFLYDKFINVYIDGKKIEIENNIHDPFIHLQVDPGDKNVVIVFQRFDNIDLILCVSMSIIMIIALLAFSKLTGGNFLARC